MLTFAFATLSFILAGIALYFAYRNEQRKFAATLKLHVKRSREAEKRFTKQIEELTVIYTDKVTELANQVLSVKSTTVIPFQSSRIADKIEDRNVAAVRASAAQK